MNDIVRLSATTLADHIRTGQLSSVEVINAHLDRIAEVNPELNAIIYVLEESARRQATEADAARRRGESLGPLYAEALAVWSGIMVGSFGPSLDMMWPILGEDTKTFLDPFYQASKGFDLPTFVTLIDKQRWIGEAWSNFFATFDVIVSPTWARPPFAVGADLTGPGLIGETFRSVQPANLLGLPSACVPITTVSAPGGELPVGVQITGPRFSDYLCLDVAEQLEAAEPSRTPIDPRSSS